MVGASTVLLVPAAPVASSETRNTVRAVQLTEDAATIALANGEIRLVFEKTGGKLKSFAWRGQELLASGGAYIQVALTGKKGQPAPI
jgi:hypothetical protein